MEWDNARVVPSTLLFMVCACVSVYPTFNKFSKAHVGTHDWKAELCSPHMNSKGQATLFQYTHKE